MTKEEKELLLQYKIFVLGLPYGTVIYVEFNDVSIKPITETLNLDTLKQLELEFPNIYSIKPYLRPMSSMTDEEIETYESFITSIATDETGAWELIDWLNAHHFDYRGNLIPNGLAIEAPNGMYNIK